MFTLRYIYLYTALISDVFSDCSVTFTLSWVTNTSIAFSGKRERKLIFQLKIVNIMISIQIVGFSIIHQLAVKVLFKHPKHSLPEKS
jgi:hypothetical protein